MADHQAPPSLGFSRQEHWSGLSFPSPMHEAEKWKWSCLVVSDSWWPHGLQPTRLLHPWDFPGKSTRVGCHCLLQRTNPREYQIVRTHTKENTWHDPTTSSTLCRMPHLNNKQNKHTNPIISKQDYHLTQPCPSEEKPTNKNSVQIIPYTKLTQTIGPNLGEQKSKGIKNSALKPGKRRPQTQ